MTADKYIERRSVHSPVLASTKLCVLDNVEDDSASESDSNHEAGLRPPEENLVTLSNAPWCLARGPKGRLHLTDLDGMLADRMLQLPEPEYGLFEAAAAAAAAAYRLGHRGVGQRLVKLNVLGENTTRPNQSSSLRNQYLQNSVGSKLFTLGFEFWLQSYTNSDSIRQADTRGPWSTRRHTRSYGPSGDY